MQHSRRGESLVALHAALWEQFGPSVFALPYSRERREVVRDACLMRSFFEDVVARIVHGLVFLAILLTMVHRVVAVSHPIAVVPLTLTLTIEGARVLSSRLDQLRTDSCFNTSFPTSFIFVPNFACV